MDKCLLNILIDNRLKTFTCDEVKELQYEWKKKFREDNGTEAIIASGGTDRSYIQFCDRIDNFLHLCPHHKVGLHCEKCSSNDHDGYFCRCVPRNINLAKQLRKEQKDNRAQAAIKAGSVNE